MHLKPPNLLITKNIYIISMKYISKNILLDFTLRHTVALNAFNINLFSNLLHSICVLRIVYYRYEESIGYHEMA